MSVETDRATGRAGEATAGFDIELVGALVARAGVRRGRIVVPEGSTLTEVVETWADECGSHLRFALLEGDRLRSDIRAVQVADDGNERLVGSRQVVNGDTIRFELRE